MKKRPLFSLGARFKRAGISEQTTGESSTASIGVKDIISLPGNKLIVMADDGSQYVVDLSKAHENINLSPDRKTITISGITPNNAPATTLFEQDMLEDLGEISTRAENGDQATQVALQEAGGHMQGPEFEDPSITDANPHPLPTGKTQ